jgi:hypothetical protein
MMFRGVYGGYKVSPDGVVIGKRGKPLKPVDNGRGYGIVSLYVDGRIMTKAVHRLVAEAYIINLKGLPEVDHIDGDKTNNSVSNLRWCTRSQNIDNAYKTGSRSATGEVNANANLGDNEVKLICMLLQEGYRQSEIRDMGFPYATVRAIKQRRQWVHISKEYSWN